MYIDNRSVHVCIFSPMQALHAHQDTHTDSHRQSKESESCPDLKMDLKCCLKCEMKKYYCVRTQALNLQ